MRLALAQIAARLVALRGWERLGFARLADYARERAGLSARQLQDLACTAVRLAALPHVTAALLANGTGLAHAAGGRAIPAIGWCQARLLARVARPEDETAWVAFAGRSSVRALERAVRAVDMGSIEAGLVEEGSRAGGSLEARTLAADSLAPRQCESDPRWESLDEAAPFVTVSVRCTPGVRGRFHYARQVARRVAGEALPTWACMEAIAAEGLSGLPLGMGIDVAVSNDCAHDGWSVAATAAAPAATDNAAGVGAWELRIAGPDLAAPALPERPREGESASPPADMCVGHGAAEVDALLVALVSGLDDADAFALDDRLRRAVALEQRLDAEAARELRVVADAGAHRTLGWIRFDDYARDRLGLSPRKARALLRVERAGDRVPALREAFRGGTLSWVQVETLLPLLLLPELRRWCAGWIDRAAEVTVRRLEDDVDRALALHAADPDLLSRTGSLADPDAPSARPIERQACARATPTENRPDEGARFFFLAPRPVARLFRAVVCSVRRHLERLRGRLPTEGEAVDWLFDHAFETWGLGERRVSRAHRVFERDGWRCTVPGCTSYRNLHDHHVVFRAAGGADDLANRTTLCAWHHLRGVHAGRVRCTGSAPAGLVFELGLRTGRAPLARYDAAERRLAPPAPLAPAPTAPAS